jgi:hypothetical protein
MAWCTYQVSKVWKLAITGMTLPQYFRCSDLPVKSVPSPLEDIRRAVKELAEIGNPPLPDRIVIRHHPDDVVDALALIAGMEPWRYHLAETEEVPKGDPEIFVIDHMPHSPRRKPDPGAL